MRAVSLFAGVGGFDLAADRAGIEVVGQVEIDKYARSVLERHWPLTSRWEDIHDVTVDDLLVLSDRREPLPSVDEGGERVDQSGERGGDRVSTSDSDRLGGTDDSEMLRVHDHASVELDGVVDAVLSDDPGVGASREQSLHHRDSGRSGYADEGDGAGPAAVDVLVGGFPCQSYSVAGQRGGLADDRGALWWEFHRLIAGVRPTWVVGENVPGLLSSGRGRDFGEIVGSLTDLGYGVVWRVLDSRWFGVPQRRRRVFIVGHSGGRPRPEVLALAQGMSGDSPPGGEEGKGVAAVVEGRPDLSSRVAGTGGLTGGFRSTDLDNIGAYAVGVPDPAYALTAREYKGPSTKESASTYVLPAAFDATGVRRLTPLECERLQGFPDGWADNLSDTQRYRAMGNAVTVDVAEWILKRLVEADRSDDG